MWIMERCEVEPVRIVWCEVNPVVASARYEEKLCGEYAAENKALTDNSKLYARQKIRAYVYTRGSHDPSLLRQ